MGKIWVPHFLPYMFSLRSQIRSTILSIREHGTDSNVQMTCA
jgi:hypothetical protein